jgi:hypothetical protein
MVDFDIKCQTKQPITPNDHMSFPSLAADWRRTSTLVTDGGGLYFIVQQSASYENPPVPLPSGLRWPKVGKRKGFSDVRAVMLLSSYDYNITILPFMRLCSALELNAQVKSH